MLTPLLICWYGIGVAVEIGVTQRRPGGRKSSGADWFIILLVTAWLWPRHLFRRRKWWER